MHRLSTLLLIGLASCGDATTRSKAPGSPARAAWDSTRAILQAGDTLRIKVRVLDAFGIPIPSQSVSLAVTASPVGPLTIGAFISDPDGYVTTRWAAPTKAGTYSVQAAAPSPLGASDVSVYAGFPVGVAPANGVYTMLVGQHRTFTEFLSGAVVPLDKYGNAAEILPPLVTFSLSAVGGISLSSGNVVASTVASAPLQISFQGAIPSGSIFVRTQVVGDIATSRPQLTYLCQRNPTDQQDSLRVFVSSANMRYSDALTFPVATSAVRITGDFAGQARTYAGGIATTTAVLQGVIIGQQGADSLYLSVGTPALLPADMTLYRSGSSSYAASATLSPCPSRWQVRGALSLSGVP